MSCASCLPVSDSCRNIPENGNSTSGRGTAAGLIQISWQDKPSKILYCYSCPVSLETNNSLPLVLQSSVAASPMELFLTGHLALSIFFTACNGAVLRFPDLTRFYSIPDLWLTLAPPYLNCRVPIKTWAIPLYLSRFLLPSVITTTRASSQLALRSNSSSDSVITDASTTTNHQYHELYIQAQHLQA